MAGLTPPNNVSAAAEADEHELAGGTEQLSTYIYFCSELLPAFPYLDNRRLTALPSSDGVDRISLLPDALLTNIVSRLLVTDAACTAVLSSRWRRVWLSTPLSLIDAYLRPTVNSPDISATVSHILEVHPGPFRCVHLVSCDMNACQAQLARWLVLLAAKGVQELVLVNRQCKPDVPFPSTLFSITTLTRLYIGLWKFPDVATLPRGTSFPHLREVGICSDFVDSAAVEALVTRSPILEFLSIKGNNKSLRLRLRLVSQSLRCVQICGSVLEKMTVVKAPCLNRLILEASRHNDPSVCTRVSIAHGSELHALGMLEPGVHTLEIQGTIIVAGIKVSPSTMLPQVKILSLNVCFGNHNDVKMVPTFLTCFPNLEKLHITSKISDYQAGSAKLNLKLWDSAKPTKNVKQCIKVMSFREFRGEMGEVAFLKFFFRSARVLQSGTIMMANPRFTSVSQDEMFSRAKQALEKMASKCCKLTVLGSDGPVGGIPWSPKRGVNYSFEDPFSAVEWVSGA